MLFCFSLPLPPSIVTNDCYPYNSGLTPEMKMQRGACYIQGVKTADNKMSCPKLGMKSSRYQSTPPYRISPSVSVFREICGADSLLSIKHTVGL